MSPPAPADREGAVDVVHVENRRIRAALGLDEGIAEPVEQAVAGRAVGPDRQAGAGVEHDLAQIVDAVHVIGMGMGVDHRIERADARIHQLRPHVGRGVDQDAGRALLRLALHQQRAATAGVPGVGGVAVAPVPAKPRHTAGGAAAEDGEAQPAGHAQALYCVSLGEQALEVRFGEGGEVGVIHPERFGPAAGGVRGKGGLVALAAMGRRREVGTVGLHQDPVARRGGKDVAQLPALGERRDARHGKVETEVQRRPGQRGGGRETVHHADIGPGAIRVRQDLRHVLVGVARMDHQRQAGFLRGLDMDAEAAFLNLGAFGSVVIIEPGLADRDEFLVAGQRHQLLHRRHRLLGRAHRMGARGIEHLVMRLGEGTHRRFVAQPGADRHHAMHARRAGAGEQVGNLPVEIREIEVAVAVCDPGLGHAVRLPWRDRCGI